VIGDVVGGRTSDGGGAEGSAVGSASAFSGDAAGEVGDVGAASRSAIAKPAIIANIAVVEAPTVTILAVIAGLRRRPDPPGATADGAAADPLSASPFAATEG
jgi:hypothetical protein